MLQFKNSKFFGKKKSGKKPWYLLGTKNTIIIVTYSQTFSDESNNIIFSAHGKFPSFSWPMIVPSFFLCVQKEERTFLRFYCHAYILVHSVLVIIRTTAVNDCLLYGNPYLHDRRANKSCTTRKRLQNHTFRNPSLKLLCVLFSYSLLCALLGGRWWRSSVFRSMILFWISSAIQQQTPQANTTATGTVAAGQQRPRAPTTPAGNTPSR